MREMMDRMMREPLFTAWPSTGAMTPQMEVTEDGDQYHVRLAVPGVKPEDVRIQLEQNVLTISGELRQDPTHEGRRTLHQERAYGTFARSIALPGTIDADKVTAQFEHGVLTIALPKHAAARPRQIKIQSGGGSGGQVIQGQAAAAQGGQTPQNQESEDQGEKSAPAAMSPSAGTSQRT
jgi:HSP20 family protein